MITREELIEKVKAGDDTALVTLLGDSQDMIAEISKTLIPRFNVLDPVNAVIFAMEDLICSYAPVEGGVDFDTYISNNIKTYSRGMMNFILEVRAEGTENVAKEGIWGKVVKYIETNPVTKIEATVLDTTKPAAKSSKSLWTKLRGIDLPKVDAIPGDSGLTFGSSLKSVPITKK